jgi:hypothetical protein
MAESCHHNDSQKERGREMDGKGEGHAPHICAPRVWQNRVQNPCHSCRDRILANPSVLNSAQRAFLKDGCIQQCINTALNVFEDFKDKKAKDKQLFVISYDQEKAYDSVQAYTIKASLERFNLPEDFIRFVLSGLEKATSCFKTFYGLTEDFKVETSVRQGDPLSPLIYIFVVDALHEGWKNNPLYRRETGYCFSNDKTLRISSTGYADDAMIYAETWAYLGHESMDPRIL